MFRGENVTDDTGCNVVFTERGASASQIDGSKSPGHKIPSTRNGWTSE